MSVTIQQARAMAFKFWPYLATPLAGIKLIEERGLGTMAVTDKWQVYYDPDVLNKWGLEASAAVLAHEVWHPLRGHARRRGDRDARLWNVACDIAINDDELLRDKLPNGGVHWHMFQGLRAGMVEEEIYDVLVAQQPPAPQDGGRPGVGQGQGGDDVKDRNGKAHGKSAGDGKCGSGATGIPDEWESADDGTGHGGEDMSAAERALMERGVAEAIQTCGSASAGAKRWAGQLLAPPTIPWQQVLRVALRRAVRMTRGATDYAYRRPRLRSGVVMPRLVNPTQPVAVVLDTSGSVSGPLLDAALAEVDGILRAVKLPCTVLACDAQVHGGAQLVKSAREVKPLGGGGTDMGRGIKAADELRPMHGAIVVLTDGYTPWPKAPPRTGLCVVCLIGGDDAVAAKVPGWATVIRVQ